MSIQLLGPFCLLLDQESVEVLIYTVYSYIFQLSTGTVRLNAAFILPSLAPCRLPIHDLFASF